MQIENLTKPGVAPVDGDLVRITYDSGTVETKQYFAPRLPPPPVEPVKTRISKYDLIKRLTPDEAEILLADFMNAPGYLSLLWGAIMYIDTTDDDYETLKAIVVNRLGETRAAEVLAPKE